MRRCETCGGSGQIEVEYTVADQGCCGNFLPTGECCQTPVAVPMQVIEPAPCPTCQGTGKVKSDG